MFGRSQKVTSFFCTSLNLKEKHVSLSKRINILNIIFNLIGVYKKLTIATPPPPPPTPPKTQTKNNTKKKKKKKKNQQGGGGKGPSNLKGGCFFLFFFFFLKKLPKSPFLKGKKIPGNLPPPPPKYTDRA